VRLAGDALEAHPPPGAALLTEKQQARLEALFAVSEHVEVEATWGIYQRMIAYREPDKKHGKAMMQAVIDSVASGVPATLTEIRKLGRTLKQRATDILALFDRPGTSNGPTEAINGRLEHLRGSALGFRNLTNYIARSLLEAGGFRPRLHPRYGRPRLPGRGRRYRPGPPPFAVRADQLDLQRGPASPRGAAHHPSRR
jgi:hypothetical protein